MIPPPALQERIVEVDLEMLYFFKRSCIFQRFRSFQLRRKQVVG